MKSNTVDIDFAKQLFAQPENFIDSFDLKYATDSMLNINRKLSRGKFTYLKKGKSITNKKILKRIKKMAIPPAWKNVKIASNKRAHIQATGRDEKGRKQYIYHDDWSLLRNQTKFYKMYAFGKQLPKLREKVEYDLKSSKWSKQKVLALIISLLEETHIRIGNAYYASANKTYGLSTLRTRHVDIYKGKLKFEFKGKRGKEYCVTIRNKKLIKLVQQCEDIPGWELFKYYDEEGIKHCVDSTMVNEYLQEISGDLFTAKDFRTWGASKICFETLLNQGLAQDKQIANNNILVAIDTAAEALGNTRSVVKQYYVHPKITESYLDGTIKPYFTMEKGKDKNNLTATESAMLKLIYKYEPKL
ncbi:DNA topoisomerase IB [Winogradskyella sp.]|uniref:DNA topoisomerase IB n=1 Tax=Winogradskyella sp. TaxID=1883156 RepID=UPI003516FDE0